MNVPWVMDWGSHYVVEISEVTRHLVVTLGNKAFLFMGKMLGEL